MKLQDINIEDLTAEERIELMGRLWDSLDAAVSAPITPDLARELAQDEAKADADPEAGESWDGVKRQIEEKYN